MDSRNPIYTYPAAPVMMAFLLWSRPGLAGCAMTMENNVLGFVRQNVCGRELLL